MLNYKNLPIGISNFSEIVETGCILIDKTMLVKEVMENRAKVILFTRPRRFGKTLAMTMLGEFLSLSGKDVFGALNIAREEEFCSLNQNQYPVIFISFKDCKDLSFEEVFEQLKTAFATCYKNHAYSLESLSLRAFEKEKFELIMKREVSDSSQLSDALSNLISYLHTHTGKNVVVLIDEYDSPIHSAYEHGFYEKMVAFMRRMLGSALKDNPLVEKCVITGICRVSQESLFSGLNHVRTYTVLDNAYAQYFGFTQDEVETLLPSTDLIEPIKKWYNGYCIGGLQIYNPWSIIECLSNEAIIMPYWVNTSDNSLVHTLINGSRENMKESFDALIQGIPQHRVISNNLAFKYLENDEEAIWTLLIHAGYLNVISKTIDEEGDIHAVLEIPNKEVMSVYIKMVRNWFSTQTRSTGEYDDLLADLDKGNIDEFARKIQAYILESGSYFDFTKHTPERVFHVFMLGIVVGLRSRYDITSNREKGLGRADMVMVPKDTSKPSIALEFKSCGDPQKLGEMADKALDQIREKKYVTGPATLVSMVFCGKEMVYRYEK